MKSMQFTFRFLQFACFIWLSWKENWPKSTAFHLTDAGEKTPGFHHHKQPCSACTTLTQSPLPQLINSGHYCNKRSDLSENKRHKNIFNISFLLQYKFVFFQTSSIVSYWNILRYSINKTLALICRTCMCFNEIYLWWVYLSRHCV